MNNRLVPVPLMLAMFLVSCAVDRNRSRTSLSPQHEPAPITTSAPVRHFWFEYKSQPDPGHRVWVQVDSSTWAELYPSGSQSRYKYADRTDINGLHGVVVRKVAGDPRQTWTLNDGSFEVFIPDRDNPHLILAFRHYQNGQWLPWQPLGLINPIE